MQVEYHYLKLITEELFVPIVFACMMRDVNHIIHRAVIRQSVAKV